MLGRGLKKNKKTPPRVLLLGAAAVSAKVSCCDDETAAVNNREFNPSHARRGTDCEGGSGKQPHQPASSDCVAFDFPPAAVAATKKTQHKTISLAHPNPLF